MRSVSKIFLATLGLFAITGFSGTPSKAGAEPFIEAPMRLEDPIDSASEAISEPEPAVSSEEEQKPCKVTIEKAEHGTVKTDILEGEIGDIVTVTAKHDLLYTVDFVAVNGVSLIEDEDISGRYQFALAEGENVITARFVVDEELCGAMTEIVKEASEGDWESLFTVENLLTVIKWIMDGGILVAMVAYFIKDKKLATKIEKAVTEKVSKAVPDATKQAVLAETKTLIEPMFSQYIQDSALARQLMCIVVKCMVLMQQNTPEAKVAILNEFEKLKGIVDLDSIANVKKFIEETVEKQAKAYQDTIKRLNNIEARHQEAAAPAEDEPKDNGTQI